MALKVGLILYSVRDEMAKDPIATVRKVGECGYKYIETCNHNAIKDPGCGFGVPAEELKAAFDEFGSKVVSTHIFPLESADIKEVVKYNSIVGNKNLVNPMGSFSTYDDMMKQIEGFNELGRQLREEGMTFLYHNHHFEFKTFNGKTIEDYIMENTDPEYLSFELDTFWVMRSGLCPVEMLKHMGKRVKLVHQKDFAWDSTIAINVVGRTPEEREMQEGEFVGMNAESNYAKAGGKHTVREEREDKAFSEEGHAAFTEIGTGIMHIQDIIDAANEYTDAEYIILEQDYTRMPTQIDSIKKSMEGFRKFSGISWE
ncbi:MAG: sugar phosphate isomerase/epimerase [Lachnospiraceae bacterium]|nr:sugar phosphate isomerase/epimerase [Lachnospiraceae bacterium]